MASFAEWPPAAKALGALFGAMLLACVWSLLASTVFLAGTNMLGNREGVPFLEWWSYFRWYGFSNPRVGNWLKIAAAVATGIPLLLGLARVLRGGTGHLGSAGLHGSTRWANRREMKAAGFYAKFGGLYVGKDARGKHLRFGGPEHVACYAPTRSGKGVGLVIPNCLLYEASLVCLDVKKENWAATAGIREAAGQKVFLFDPLAPDGRTARYNPFSYVRRDTIDAFEDIQRIAQMVFPHVSGDQAFWQDSARSAFVGAAGYLAESPELPLTFGEVLRQLSGNEAATLMLQRIEARRLADNPYTEATVKALEDYLKGSADLVNSIRKTVTAKLSLWYNPRIDAATAASDFDLRQLRNSLHAIYVGVTPDNIARLRPLLALFFQQLVDLQVRTLPQHDPDAKHQVLLLLDEFPLLGAMPVLADAFAFVAGFGVRLMLIMQSKAQLRDRDLYGPDKADAILDNCGLEVVFGTKDLNLTEELSARIGYDTVEAASRSGPRFWRLLRRDKLSLTESDQRRALLLPQEIARMKPEDAIFIKPGMFPVRAKRIKHYADPLFMRLLRAPPRVEPIDIDVRLDRGPAGRAAPAAPPAAAPPSQSVAIDASAADEGTDSGTNFATNRGTTAAASAGTAAPMSCTVQDLAGESTAARQPGKRKPNPQKSCTVQDSGTGTKAAPIAPVAAAEREAATAPALKPHQSDSLLSSVMGADIDLSDYGLSDAKRVVAQMIDRVPTAAPARGRRTAAE